MRFSKTILPVMLSFAFVYSGHAQQAGEKSDTKMSAPARAEVLVLGSEHLANPGRDLYDVHVDDVLAPKRQAEIAQLVEVLKRFQPTKIAVEADSDSGIDQKYSDYLAGKHELSRSEDEQIGFRLAKESGLKTIYPVNEWVDFPYPRLVDYVKANGQTKQFDELNAVIAATVKADQEYLSSHTILQAYLQINADRRAQQDAGVYYQMAHFGTEGDFAGADLLSDWFHRNADIFTNIVNLVGSPNERILVIYGSGHLPWLRNDIAGDPTLRLRKLSDFVTDSDLGKKK